MERRAAEALAERWLNEAMRERKLAVFDELLLPNVQSESGGQVTHGSEPFKHRASAVHGAFSNIETTLDQLVVEGNQLAWRWSLTGTHSGAFAGVEATGRRVTLSGVNFQQLQGGRVAAHWTLADTFGLMAALRAPAR